MKISILVLSLSIILYTNLYSQEDSIISVDYSKITLSTDIVPQWKVQVEVGGSSWYSEDTRDQLQGTPGEYFISNYHLMMDIPSLAFRIGILKNAEIRIAAVFKQKFHTVKSNSLLIFNRQVGYYSGGPIEAGLKAKLFTEKKYLPSAAASVTFFIPAGDYYFNMDYVSPLFKILLKKEISKNFSIGGNLGYGWNVYDRFTDKYGSYSIAIDAKISKKLNAFAETYSYFQYKSTPDHRLGAGLSYRFSRNVMVNVAGGLGLSERSPDLYGSGGIGFLFP